MSVTIQLSKFHHVMTIWYVDTIEHVNKLVTKYLSMFEHEYNVSFPLNSNVYITFNKCSNMATPSIVRGWSLSEFHF